METLTAEHSYALRAVVRNPFQPEILRVAVRVGALTA
jgi:hypothetical protein